MGLNKRLIGAGAVGSGALTPSENFSIVLYSGTGSTQSITGVGFKPDWVWIKRRDGTENHYVQDSTRGSTKQIYTNLTNAEFNETGAVTSFDTDGFTMGNYNGINNNGETYVAWCWKANGGTTSSNSDGSITSTVQANQDAGFSIVKYTGSGSGASVGHGLSSEVKLILQKRISSSSDWLAGALEWTKYLELNGTPPFRTANVWQDTAPTSSVFTVINSTSTSSVDYINYCFADVTGYQKISSYEGNGSTDGLIVETGFEPALVMVKNVDSTDNWLVFDNARNTSNPRNKLLQWNLNAVESTEVGAQMNFYSNGFQSVGTGGGSGSGQINSNGDTYLYLAIAADPDTDAPTLASSFNIEEYTGNSSAAVTVNGLGFAPNLVWAKSRTPANEHNLYDTIRGATFKLKSNATSAQESSGALDSFTSDGFTLRSGGYSLNQDNNTYVAWNWKADDNEPTAFFNSVVTGVYKFEDNVNDVAGVNNGANGVDIAYTSSGKFNKAVVSNGTNTEVSLSQTPPMTTAWTFSFWFYATESGSAIRIILQTGTGFAIGLELSKIYIFTGGSNRGSGTSISLNTWYHYAATYDGTSVKTYLNGSLAETITTLTGMSAGNLKLFDPPYGSWAHYTGRLDQLRVYSTGLSSTQITALYNETTSDNDTVEFPTGLPNGSVASIVSANANAGFSIVNWEGNGVATSRVPHGLSAKPDMVIVKDLSEAGGWNVAHVGLASNEGIGLQSNGAAFTSMGNNGGITYGNLTATTFGFATGAVGVDSVNKNGNDYIAYCFHDVAGYQKFGSYTGNGSAGHAITVGFKPDFVLLKSSTSAENWSMFDSRRGEDVRLYANTNDDDESNTSFAFSSTGFVLPQFGSMNGNGQTFIYWAIAKNVPSNTTLANSFKAVTYSGTGASQAITTGFTPDLVWIKRRNATDLHVWTDSVRGTDKQLFSNQTDAQSVTNTRLTSFDTNGFTLSGSGTRVNESGGTYVAWAWKAGNTWQSNLDGSINSITNTNTANGFSVVKYTGDGNSARTVGHGLTAKCDLVIIKGLDSADKWVVQLPQLGDNARCVLEGAAGKTDDSTTAQAGNATVFGIGGDNAVNKSGDEFIAYCWHSVSGYSKIGTYSGTGSSQTITTGFTPDFVITKKTNGTDNWRMYDSVRQNAQPFDEVLYPNLSDGEDDNTNGISGTTATGFTLGTGNLSNNSGDSYIYIAFKMN